VTTPADTVDLLARALNRGDLDAALALYEPNAVLVVQPGRRARGTDELRAALAGFIALNPTLRTDKQHVTEASGIALYQGRWTLRGTDPAGQEVLLGGDSTDVLRQQADGRWLIALDNPWGARLLDA
jgi:uncharacterized protein (TIGR02246 family)